MRQDRNSLNKAFILTSNDYEEGLANHLLGSASKREQRWFRTLKARNAFIDKRSGIESLIASLEE